MNIGNTDAIISAVLRGQNRSGSGLSQAARRKCSASRRSDAMPGDAVVAVVVERAAGRQELGRVHERVADDDQPLVARALADEVGERQRLAELGVLVHLVVDAVVEVVVAEAGEAARPATRR